MSKWCCGLDGSRYCSRTTIIALSWCYARFNSGDLNADKYYWRTNIRPSLEAQHGFKSSDFPVDDPSNVTLKSVTYTVVEETVDVSGDYHYVLGRDSLTVDGIYPSRFYYRITEQSHLL